MNDRPPTELRRDPLTGRKVIVAVQRSERPHYVGNSTMPADDRYDPFAEGNEHDTPAESLSLRRADSERDQPGWLLRVVPNRYPAVTPPTIGGCQRPVIDSEFPAQEAFGIHEVVIECPDSRTRLADLSVVEVTRVLVAWQTRLKAFSERPGISTVHIFRNEGAMAGASLPHCHSQILATQWLDSEDRQASHDKRRDVFHGWLKQELTAGERIVKTSEQLVVVCPFASRVAWQVRFFPNICGGQVAVPFGKLSLSELQSLAAELLSVAISLRNLRGEVSFNLALKLPPVAIPDAYPWFLDLMPRTGQFAGFELLATTTDIVTTAPETAAASYRGALESVRRDVTDETLWPPGYRWV